MHQVGMSPANEFPGGPRGESGGLLGQEGAARGSLGELSSPSQLA
jgi:hypothetical protein